MLSADLNPRFSVDVVEDDEQFHVSVFPVKDGVASQVPVSVYHFDRHSGVTAEELLRAAAPHLFA